MPTIAELFRTYDNASATVAVNVDGVQLGRVDGVDYSFAIGLVPTATVRIAGDLPAGVLFRSRVTIDEGFNGVTQRRFTGRVYHINPDERGYTLECMGQSWVLDVPYHDVVLTIDNVTVSAAVTTLLQSAGAVLYSVDVPARTMGTTVLSSDPDRAKVALEFQTYGEAITKIAEPDGSRWMEMPDGAIRVRQADPIPSLTAGLELFAMELGDGYVEAYPSGVTQTLNGRATRPRIRTIRAEKQIREVKNRCVVKGATYEQVNADGTVDAIDVEATAQAPSPWIRAEDGTQAYNTELYSNEVLDTAAWAGEVAGRIVGVKNRLNDRLIMTVDGCPLVQLGMTVLVADPQYSGVVGRYFVEEYSTSISAGEGGDYVTTITCVGGSEAGGTVNVSPFAVFSHTVEREVIGDRVWAVVTLDARQSTDPDGSIASYAWSGDVTGTGAILYKRVDPTVVGDSISVTLTVTDDQGATDAITLEVPVNAGTGGAFIPAMFAAGDTHFSASPDGGINWNDQAIGGGGSVISVGARPNDGSPGIAVYGTQAGALYRTTDFCATALTLVMAAVGSPIVHIGRSYAQDHNVMWALTQDGRLYRSNDSGVTWFLWDDLKIKFSKPNLRASRIATPAPDGVWVFGGDGEGLPFIAWDPVKSHAWGGPALGGELLQDLGLTGVAATLYFMGESHDAIAATTPGSTTWTSNRDAGSTYGSYNSFCKLRYQNGSLFRLAIITSSGELGNNAVGQLQRSSDDGATWTDIGPGAVQFSGGSWWGVRSYDFAVDGRLYAIAGIDQTTGAVDEIGIRIYRVDDPHTASPTFTLIHSDDELGSDGVDRVNGISCHQNDAAYVVATYRFNNGGSSRLRTVVSTNATAGSPSFTKNTASTGVLDHAWVVVMDDGSLIQGGVNDSVYRSVDDGVTWTTVISGTGPQRLAWNTRGPYGTGKLFVGRGDRIIDRTLDNGATWVRIVNNVSAASTRNLLYDPISDTLYFVTSSIVATGRIFSYPNASTVGVDGLVETDISGNIDTLGGNWGSVSGSCAAIAPGITGDPTLYIADYASVGQGDLAILLNSAAHTPALYFTNAIIGDGSAWRRAAGAPAKARGKWLTSESGVDSFGRFQFGYDDEVVYLADESGGVLTVSVAAAAMDAGDEGNHALAIGGVIGGVGGAHIVAAEGTADGTLYKTWDRFASIAKLLPATGFDAPPAGWNAKMIDVSIGALGTGSDERLVSIGIDVSPRESSYLIGLGGDWTSPVGVTGITDTDPKVWPLTDQLWFVTNGGDTYASSTWGSAARSIDGGASWSACATPTADGGWLQFVMDAGGRVWGLMNRTPADTEARVYYSDDNGASWTLSQTVTVAGVLWYGTGIAAHPLNQNIIVFTMTRGAVTLGGRLYYTTNRGGAWNFNANNDIDVLDEHDRFELRMASSGRIHLMGRSDVTNTQRFQFSDDYGLTWTIGSVEAGSNRYWGMFISGDRVAYLKEDTGTGDVRLWLSTNGGASFAVVTLSEELETFIGAQVVAQRVGTATSADRDAIYLTTGRAKAIVKLSPVSADGVWIDLTGAFPHATVGNQGIAVVPSP